MRFADLSNGVYSCKIADHGIKMVDINGDSVPKVVIAVDIEVDKELVRGYFEGFLTKKDGDPNQKTVKTLLDCGFESENIDDINNQGALNMELELEATVIIDDKGYRRIEWLGQPGGGMLKKADAKSYNSAMKSAFKEARSGRPKSPERKVLKNHAPKSTMRDADDSEKIPF